MLPMVSVLAAVLIGPGFESGTPDATAEPAVTAVPAFATAREARERVARALRESNRSSGRDPMETTPLVAATYRRLSLSDNLPATERKRLQAQLGTRLGELHDVLHRRVKRAETSRS